MAYLPSQFITCPRCRGEGSDPQAERNVCTQCWGMGTGTFWRGEFLYWGGALDRSAVVVRRAGAVIDNAFNAVVLGIGVLGIAAGFYAIIASALAPGGLYLGRLAAFWGERNGSLLLFWCGVLLLCFWYFRRRRQHEHWPILPVRCVTDGGHTLPNNWNELRRSPQRRDVSRYYDKTARYILEEAAARAAQDKQPAITTLHLFAAAARHAKSRAVLERVCSHLGCSLADLAAAVQEQLQRTTAPAAAASLRLTPTCRQLLIEAFIIAETRNRARITVNDLFAAFGYFPGVAKGVLHQFHLSAPAIYWAFAVEEMRSQRHHNRRRAERRRRRSWHQRLARANRAVATPVLDRFTVDLTAQARLGFNQPLVWREACIRQAVNALDPKKPAVVVLQGGRGSGKTTALRMIADWLVHERCAGRLTRYRRCALIRTDALTAQNKVGMREALLVILDEARQAGDTVVMIDDMPAELLSAIAETALPAPLVATAATATIPAVTLDALTDEEGLLMLGAAAVERELMRAPAFLHPAVTTAWRLSKRLPETAARLGGAIEFLTAAEAAARQFNHPAVTAEHVAKAAATHLKEPYTKLLAEETV